MLRNRKELLTYLIETKRLDEETNFWIDRKLPKDMYIPTIYDGVYKCIGSYTIWDEVGGIASNGLCWRPIKGGTVLFDDRY